MKSELVVFPVFDHTCSVQIDNDDEVLDRAQKSCRPLSQVRPHFQHMRLESIGKAIGIMSPPLPILEERRSPIRAHTQDDSLIAAAAGRACYLCAFGFAIALPASTVSHRMNVRSAHHFPAHRSAA